LVENIPQILYIGWNLHGVQHWDLDVHLLDHIHEVTGLFILHMFLYMVGKWQQVHITDVLGRSFPTVIPFLSWPWLYLNLGIGFIFNFALGSAVVFPDWIITTFTFSLARVAG
jgi:hypothetical protein